MNAVFKELSKVVLILGVSIGLTATADLKQIASDFSISCQGLDGRVDLLKANGVLHYSVSLPNGEVSGQVQNMDEEPVSWSEESTMFIEPSYAQAKWLDVIASSGNYVWNPPHESCLPTRAPGQCFSVHEDGSYEKKNINWIDLMVDATQSGTFQFISLDVQTPTLKETVKTLGTETKCFVSGILP